MHVLIRPFMRPAMGRCHERDEISSLQERVNSKRHFTIDRDDFIPERFSFLDEISRVNTLIEVT